MLSIILNIHIRKNHRQIFLIEVFKNSRSMLIIFGLKNFIVNYPDYEYLNATFKPVLASNNKNTLFSKEFEISITDQFEISLEICICSNSKICICSYLKYNNINF